jgi:hypothetical protein
MTQGGESRGWEGGLPPPIEWHSPERGQAPFPTPRLSTLSHPWLATSMYQAIESIYEAFANYRTPRDFPVCECCVSNEEMKLLLGRNLRALTADELSNYGANVFLTVGSLPDFKYFLPRMMELTVNDEFSWPNPQVILGKLTLAEWYDWPENERAPVLSLLKEKFACLLQDTNAEGQDIDPWICALGRCVPDITSYLEPLLHQDHESKLLGIIEWNQSLFDKGKLHNPFWSDAPDNERRVVAWLTQPRVKQLLTEKYGMAF